MQCESYEQEETHAEFVKRWRKKRGWRKNFWMDLHMFFEKICTKHLRTFHKTGELTTPWWFRLSSKIEFKLRKML